MLTRFLQNGSPYILEVKARIAFSDPRSQGYTVVTETRFASQEDMKYYDEECPAHKQLKAEVLKLKLEGPPLTVYTSC